MKYDHPKELEQSIKIVKKLVEDRVVWYKINGVTREKSLRI